MKKRILLPMLTVISVFMLSACGSDVPDKTVDNFMKSYKNLELEEASKNMTAQLKEEYESTLNEGIDEQSEEMTIEDMKAVEGFNEFEESFKSLTKELKYKVTESKVDGDLAEIKVDLTYADASEPIMTSVGEMFGKLMESAFSGKEITEEDTIKIVLDTVTENLKNYEVKTAKVSGVIKLAKENDKWVITEFDEETTNALAFGLVKGMENFNPFGDMGEEVNFGDIESDEVNN